MVYIQSYFLTKKSINMLIIKPSTLDWLQEVESGSGITVIWYTVGAFMVWIGYNVAIENANIPNILHSHVRLTFTCNDYI